ncbi:carbon storage regulator, CsrA [Tepidimicrobium xylanilyticum]|uniref:Translational regulator CsrA n=2 Tax=Tepidimicrobium xylanilyticum TaxID=1123352 RepID=A0A1H2QTN9_9FIRM|nr:carbon storage regulator, CsrA [Tepidimicrobium xylanilyticum]
MIDILQNILYSDRIKKIGVNNMLILSRKKGESIIIDGNIEIKVLEIQDGKVQIGIDAPKNVDIFRKELYKSIQEENIEAANIKLDMDQVSQIWKKKK